MIQNDNEDILDLRDKSLKFLKRGFYSTDKSPQIRHLHLDKNLLYKIDNLAHFTSVIEFTATHNHLRRMNNVGQLRNLVAVDLSNNNITCVQGLEDLQALTSLKLSRNKIKDIKQNELSRALEYIDLSENEFETISDLSRLDKLKTLLLHNNMIYELKEADAFLPVNLNKLILSRNYITDLNEVCHLARKINISELSIGDNPCVQMIHFNYRPYLLNWCSKLTVIDNLPVDELEKLRGEWLYCQGKGRSFRTGEHLQLVEYLTKFFPLDNSSLRLEQDNKLSMILKKKNEHEKELEKKSFKEDQAARCLQKYWRRYLETNSKKNLQPSTENFNQQLQVGPMNQQFMRIFAEIHSLKTDLNELRNIKIQSTRHFTNKIQFLQVQLEQLKVSITKLNTPCCEVSTQTEYETPSADEEFIAIRPSIENISSVRHPVSRFIRDLVDSTIKDESE